MSEHNKHKPGHNKGHGSHIVSNAGAEATVVDTSLVSLPSEMDDSAFATISALAAAGNHEAIKLLGDAANLLAANKQKIATSTTMPAMTDTNGTMVVYPDQAGQTLAAAGAMTVATTAPGAAETIVGAGATTLATTAPIPSDAISTNVASTSDGHFTSMVNASGKGHGGLAA